MEIMQRAPQCGDLAEFNSCRRLWNAVGRERLMDAASSLVELLGTSVAIYEANGDYATLLTTSQYCHFLDTSSRKLCGTDDNAEALASGKWHCHESCWNEASRISVETGQPFDLRPCRGGINIYAVPIISQGEVVGSINFGYGTPPDDDHRLVEIARRYGVDADELRHVAAVYEPRPEYVISTARRIIANIAEMIGRLVEVHELEQRLRHERDLARGYLDVVEVVLLVLDTGGVIRLINRKACTMLGYTQQELLGKDWFNTCLPEAHRTPMRQRHAQNVAEDGKLVEYDESPVLTNTGELRTVFWHNAVLRGNDGRITAILSSGEDVTEQRRLEESLRASEAKYRELVTEINDGIYVVDDNGVITFANRSLAEIHDLCEAGDMIGRHFLDFVAPEKKDEVHAIFTQARLSGIEPARLEVPIITGQGRKRWLEIRPVQTTTVTVEGDWGVVRDITEARDARQSLQASEERYRALVTATPVGIFRADLQGNCSYVNEHWCQLSGVSAEQAAGKGWLLALHPDDQQRVGREWLAFSRGEIFDYNIEARFLRHDGTVLWVYGRATAEHDAAGNVSGYLGTVTDISAMKQAQQRLEEQVDELERFRRVTLEREIRMKEIRDENAALKARIHALEPGR